MGIYIMLGEHMMALRPGKRIFIAKHKISTPAFLTGVTTVVQIEN